MADAVTKSAGKTPEEKAMHGKKKEFRALREHLKELRESGRKITQERKDTEVRVKQMAADLGIPLKGKKAADAGA